MTVLRERGAWRGFLAGVGSSSSSSSSSSLSTICRFRDDCDDDGVRRWYDDGGEVNDWRDWKGTNQKVRQKVDDSFFTVYNHWSICDDDDDDVVW